MKDNKKIYLLTLYSNLIKTIITSLVGIIMVPISLSYFGAEKYGVWSVINSFMIYLSMTNLGLNAAASILMNKNSEYQIKIKIFIKSLKIIGIILPLMLIILYFLNSFFYNWIDILNSPAQLLYEAKITTIVMVLFVLVNLPFSLVSSALVGFQKNYIDNLFGVINAILNLLGILIIIKLEKGLIFLAGLIGCFNLLINIIKTIYFKIYIFNENKDKKYVEIENMDTNYKFILVTGFRCLLGSIASMVVLNTDNIVISKIMGVDSVTSYSITFKLYTLAFTLIYIFNSSIIPLIGKEIQNKNFIKETYQKTYYGIVLLGGLFWIGAVAILKIIIYLWTGKDGYAGEGVVFFLGAYSYIFAIVNLNYIMINSFNYIKGIAMITWLEGGANLLISIYLSKSYGLVGIAIGTFLGTFLFPFFLFPIVLKSRTNELIVQDIKFTIKHFLGAIVPSLIVALILSRYINSPIINIGLTTLLCFGYLFLSYICLPKKYRDIKLFLKK
ncbi:MAG: oligosaccharide flippase family protein [Cetobacterium sp.]|uniref:lipopolysaccharide biosynthesis protein n=1 Tax=Cetobacterium sp. TaxID=2071632 RepID=UPI002FCB0EEC